MKFKANSRRRALEYEKDLVQYWKANKTFEKSVESRPADNAYVFYDGPPFITGVPHHGTLLSSIVKDAVPRYQAMKGKRVERVWGWDCHGLPAEVFTEKKLGIKDRRDIGTKISLEEYIVTARDNMVQTSDLWNDTIDRIGRWVDMDNAYRTMDKEYMESIWWAFKELYAKGKIYEGERVLMYCTRDATPLSKAEVTMDAGAYQDVTDPSVYVKFKLISDKTQKDILLNKNSKVLFVCFGNISRSQIAKALYNHYTRTENGEAAGVAMNDNFPNAVTYGQFEAAVQADQGPEYRGRARAVLMDNHGIDIASSSRQQLTPELIEEYDLVVNIAERGQTPGWLRGDNVVWWDVKDPHGKLDGSVIKKTHDDIEKLVKELIGGNVIDDDIDASYLLAWTTTPWTLPANTATAVNKDLDYVEVRLENGEQFILAKALVQKVLTDEKHQPLVHEVLRTLKGEELVGMSYEPLFENRGEGAHKVWSADYVSAEDGSGIVHIAPAYGEEDFELAREKKIPVVHVIDENGLYTETEWVGENVWEINKTIAKALHERGTVWKIDYIRHPYPHCHRCGTRLMYRAHPSWFFDVQGQKELMLEKNTEQIKWFPEHLKHGRFEKNMEQAPDWNLSRDRFWATAMPVWEGVDAEGRTADADGKKYQIVVGSYAELKDLSGVELEDYHRPWVDAIEFDKDGVHYTRIDKVLDGWFESGSMPFAQFHYPFENKEKFEANFPGDFIAEYVGQVRAWFYYLHVISVGLFGESPFKNVITTGIVAGNDGRKMSKSYGNYTDPNELMDKFSADSLRFLLLSSPLLSGEDFALQDKEVGDVARKLSMVWNMYDFFTMYAEVDGWEFTADMQDGNGLPLDPSFDANGAQNEAQNPLDQWIISRVHQLTKEVEAYMDDYDIPSATKPILPFLDDASNWYVRRSRRRFWKSEDDSDKNSAYRTLHYVLVRFSQLIAPFAPFMAEELFRKLTDGESVHLTDWPTTGHVNELVLSRMTQTREVIEQGLALRMFKDDNEAQIKVRQPLSTLSYTGEKLDDFYESIIAEEVNVKAVVYTAAGSRTEGEASVKLDKTITPELRREGLAREVIRHVQSARKEAGLNVDDRIELSLETDDDELSRAVIEHKVVILAETLASDTEPSTDVSVSNDNPSETSFKTEVLVENLKLTIALRKA